MKRKDVVHLDRPQVAHNLSTVVDVVLAALASVWSLTRHEETHLMTLLSARILIGEKGGKIARFRKCAFSRELFTSLLADSWATDRFLRFVCFAQCNGRVHLVSSHSVTPSTKPTPSVTSLAGTFAQAFDSCHSGWRVSRPDASDAHLASRYIELHHLDA